MPELNAGLIAVLMVMLAALRSRLLLALVVLLTPAALAQWTAAASDAAIEVFTDAFGILQVGPVSLFLLAGLALLPRYARAGQPTRRAG